MEYNKENVDRISKILYEKNIIKKTQLEYDERLSKLHNCNIYLKREDMQIVRSFKVRGAAFNIFKNLKFIKDNNMDVICASAGNHAQGVSFVCRQFEINCQIFVPRVTPAQKRAKIQYFGDTFCKLHIVGDNFDECLGRAFEFSSENNGYFVHPYNDANTIYGQSIIMNEVYEEMIPDIVISPIGGGGLVAGLLLANKTANVIGVEPETCPSAKISLHNKNITEINVIDNFVDGATVKKMGDITFDIIKNNMNCDDIYTVPVGKICEDIVDLHQYSGIIVEPAGVMSVSVLDYISQDILKGKNVVCIISGGNNDISRYQEILNRRLIFKNLLHYYIVEFIQQPGELKKYINNILGDTDDIVKFEHSKKENTEYGTVFLGIEVTKSCNIEKVEKKMLDVGFKYTKIEEGSQLFKYMVY